MPFNRSLRARGSYRAPRLAERVVEFCAGGVNGSSDTECAVVYNENPNLGDKIRYCYGVSMRKLVNFSRRVRLEPRAA